MTIRVAVLISVFLPSIAVAQSAPAPPPPRHESTGEFAFVGVSGNASTTTVGLGYETIARPGTWLFRHRIAFVRNTSDGETTAQSILYAPRVEKALNSRVSAFGEYGYFRDRFAGVSNRHGATAGLSAAVVKNGRHTLSVDGGAGYLSEDRITGDDVSSATYSTGAVYTLALSDTATLSDDVGLIGTFDRAEDWRLDHTIALTAKVTTAVSLKVSNTVRYSNFPAPGFKSTDTITAVALVATFKRQ